MLRRTPIYLVLIIVLAVSFVLAGCGGSTTTTATSTQTATMTATQTATQTSTQTATTTATATVTQTETVNKYGGTYTFALTVSPARPIGYPPEAAPDSFTDASPAVESLVRLKMDGSIEGVLATSWAIAADGKSITIGLRKGVKFHDGSDFNADVCKWNLDLEIEAGVSGARNWLSIDKVDDYTIRINIDHYDNTLLSGLASGTTQQISKATFDSKGVEYCRWHPVGTGPFIFQSYEPDAQLTYTRNPDYWETGKPYLDGIKMSIIADETVRKLAFQRGDLQSYAPLSLLDAKEFKDSGQYNLTLGGGGPYVLIPDSMNPDSPWANYKVRLAASYALDRQSLADALGFGFAIPAYQLFQSFPELNIPGLVKTEYDPAKAKELLTEAGYPNGFQTTIHAFTRIVPSDYINAVANQLNAVGIQCAIDLPTSAAYSELRYGTWDGLMGHGMAAFDNKNQDFTFYFTGLQFQYCQKPAGWQEAVDASLASQEPDPTLITAVLKLMQDDMMVIPYLEQQAFLFTDEGLHDDSGGAYRLVPGTSIAPFQYIWFDDTLK